MTAHDQNTEGKNGFMPTHARKKLEKQVFANTSSLVQREERTGHLYQIYFDLNRKSQNLVEFDRKRCPKRRFWFKFN